jgi:SH3-like domain-containing protein
MNKIAALLIFITYIFFALPGYSEDTSNKKKYNFVYLRSSEVNLRAGPDTKYPIKWTIRNKGEPLKVLRSFYQWLNVKDIHGNKGWLQEPMISVRYMYGIVVNKKPIIGYAMPSSSSKKIVKLEPGVRLRVFKCKDTGWCKIRTEKFKAWIPRKNLWGINL